MKTITYTNNQGLELKINKFSSGQFNGHSALPSTTESTPSATP